MDDLKNDAIEAATEHIRKQHQQIAMDKLKICCITLVLISVIISFAVTAIIAIKSQQKNLNDQFNALMDYVSGADITTEIIDGTDGTAIKIVGDANTITETDGAE